MPTRENRSESRACAPREVSRARVPATPKAAEGRTECGRTRWHWDRSRSTGPGLGRIQFRSPRPAGRRRRNGLVWSPRWGAWSVAGSDWPAAASGRGWANLFLYGEMHDRSRHGPDPGCDRRLGLGMIKARMQGGQCLAASLALLDLFRVHRTQPEHANRDLFSGAAVLAKILAPHAGPAVHDVLLAQDVSENRGEGSGQFRIVVKGREGFLVRLDEGQALFRNARCGRQPSHSPLHRF